MAVEFDGHQFLVGLFQIPQPGTGAHLVHTHDVLPHEQDVPGREVGMGVESEGSFEVMDRDTYSESAEKTGGSSMMFPPAS